MCVHFSSDFDIDLEKDRCDCEIYAKSLFLLNYRLRFFASRFFFRDSFFVDFFLTDILWYFFILCAVCRVFCYGFYLFCIYSFLVHFFLFFLLSSIFFLSFFFLFCSNVSLLSFSFCASHPLRLFIRVSLFAFFTVFLQNKKKNKFLRCF